MKALLVSLLVLILASCLFASKQPQASSSTVKRSWINTGRAENDVLVSFSFALKQRNIEKIHALVLDVSLPHSPQYGKFLTLDEIAEIVAPNADTLLRLEKWAQSIGAVGVNITRSRDFMTIIAPAGAVEKAFNINLRSFHHKASGRLVIRTLDTVFLPQLIADDVELTFGLTDFFDYNSERKQLRKIRAQNAQQPSSAPQFTVTIFGSESDLTITLQIFCMNGQPATSPENPCSNSNHQPEAVTIVAQPRGHPRTDHTFFIDESICNNSTGVLMCTVTIQTPPFARVNLTAHTFFSNGNNNSATAYYPTDFAPSPWITPQYIFQTYNIPQGLRATAENNSQSVVSFEGQYYSPSDLAQFFEYMGYPPQVPHLVGPNNASNPGGEATLDIQYVMGVGAGVKTTFWSVDGPGPTHGNGAYVLTWAMQIADTPQAPLVTSISYGDTEQGYLAKFGNYSYITRMNDELAKMAVRGMTVVAGAGDAGASNVGEAGNDISDTDPTCTPMRPFFPSNSPYVVSASSTFLTTNALPICQQNFSNAPIVCSQVGEVAVDVAQGLFWTTGGGFSNVTGTLPWQKEQVKQFLSLSGNSLPPSQYWNSSGRGYPDISTIGHNLIVVWNGAITPIDGTSASGPVLAGILSLLNDIRLNNNQPPIGLVTPFFYQIQGLGGPYFRDVVVGSNFNGDIQAANSPYPTYCPYGYLTQPGWDAVTGLGTPNYETLSEVINIEFM